MRTIAGSAELAVPRSPLHAERAASRTRQEAATAAAVGAALAVPAGGGPSHERRQVAVLFVDLVGFTALTDALGAEQTQVLLDAFFGAVDTIVEQTGGTVDKHIGDCVMAVFGAPRARGDDVGRAVRAAVVILAAMPEISARACRELRVHGGIAAGGWWQAASAMGRGAIFIGEIVNLAARLADRAFAGEVLVADLVRVVLRGQIRLEEVGELDAPGPLSTRAGPPTAGLRGGCVGQFGGPGRPCRRAEATDRSRKPAGVRRRGRCRRAARRCRGGQVKTGP